MSKGSSDQQEYEGGEISRRDFIEHAAKLSVGGLTAGVVAEGLEARETSAQKVAKRPRRFASRDRP